MRELGGCLIALMVAVTPAAAAKRGPEVRSVRAKPAATSPGSTIAAKVRVANRGRRRSAAAKARLALSADNRLDRADRTLATIRIPALKPRRSRTLRAPVRLPARVAAGRYLLLACVGRRCRASRALRVAPEAPAPGPGAGPSGTPTPTPEAPTPTPTATPTPGPGEDPAVPPPVGNPIDVSPVLDTSRGVTALISAADGGTLTATAANGDRFELTVPPGGLFEDAELTLTPVSALEGKPFAAEASAVDIQPHGLQLGAPAMLRITPATAIPVAEQFTFAAREAGKDFHAYAPTLDTSVIDLPLLHFSTYGTASVGDAEADAITGLPKDALAQYEKAVAEEILRVKREGDSIAESELGAIMRDYYAKIVRPRMLAAQSDDTLANLAVLTYLAWSRQVQLAGISDQLADLDDEGRREIPLIMDYAYDVAFVRCMDGELAYAHAMIQMARGAQLAGATIAADAMSRFRQCARFELDYEADLHELHNEGSDMQVDIAVVAPDIPLVASLDLKEFNGSSSPVVQSYYYRASSGSATPCDWSAGRSEVKAPVAVRMLVGLASRIETAPDGRTRYALVRDRPRAYVDPGRIDLYIRDCHGNEQLPFVEFYRGYFYGIWSPEAQPGGLEYFFKAFFQAPAPSLALFLEERDRPTEHTERSGRLRMEIVHTPKYEAG